MRKGPKSPSKIVNANHNKVLYTVHMVKKKKKNLVLTGLDMHRGNKNDMLQPKYGCNIAKDCFNL